MRPIDADALKEAFEEDGHLSAYIEELIDVFRNMSDVEIADFMLRFLDCSACPIQEDCEDDCKGTWIEFLESEVSEDA